MTIYNYSKTPADNDDAVDNINWLEGQDPNTVNNSSRQMMAELAGWRDDQGAVALSAGTGSAYTLQTAQIGGVGPHDTITALADGNVVWFRVHETNDNAEGVDATLNVNGLNSVPLRGLSGVVLEAGTLVAGQNVGAFYSSTGPEWILVGLNFGTVSFADLALDVQGQLVQVGFVRPKFETEASPGWLDLDGAVYNIPDFPFLGALYGDRYGGDGVNTFGVPDARGRMLRMIDTTSVKPPDAPDAGGGGPDGNDPDESTRTPAPGS